MWTLKMTTPIWLWYQFNVSFVQEETKKIVRFWSESAIYQQGKRSWFSSGLAEKMGDYLKKATEMLNCELFVLFPLNTDADKSSPLPS